MTPDEIFAALQQQLPDVGCELQKSQVGDAWILVPPKDILRVLTSLRDELGMNYLACLSGVDYESSFGVVYQLRSLAKKTEITVKSLLSKENPVIESVSGLYAVADWFEREAFDLLGIQFENHGDLRRIMMPDDWIGHPLRKDYQPPDEYHGIPFERPDSHALLDELFPRREVVENPPEPTA